MAQRRCNWLTPAGCHPEWTLLIRRKRATRYGPTFLGAGTREAESVWEIDAKGPIRRVCFANRFMISHINMESREARTQGPENMNLLHYSRDRHPRISTPASPWLHCSRRLRLTRFGWCYQWQAFLLLVALFVSTPDVICANGLKRSEFEQRQDRMPRFATGLATAHTAAWRRKRCHQEKSWALICSFFVYIALGLESWQFLLAVSLSHC
jgi:hypothetical protein